MKMEKLTGARHLQGTSLVEYLVSLTIGSLLLLFAFHLMSLIKESSLRQQAIARLQENARILSHVMGKAILESGFMGCRPLGEDSIFYLSPLLANNSLLEKWFPLRGLSASDWQHFPLIKQRIERRIIPRSEILWVMRMRHSYSLIKESREESDYFLIKGQPHFKVGKLFAITDCEKIALFPLAGIQKSALRQTTQLYVREQSDRKIGNSFKSGAQVGLFSSLLFYVGDTQRKNHHGDPIYALYKTDLHGGTRELVEGVEGIKIKYGLIKDAQWLYLPVRKIKNWEKVRRVRVTLLLNSVERIGRQKALLNTSMGKTGLLKKKWTYEWAIQNFN